MTYAQVELGLKLALFFWFPVCSLIFFYLTYRSAKILIRNINSHKRRLHTFFYILPPILVFFIMLIPVFYFHHLSKQYRYCVDIVQFNHITTTENEFLQERCSDFDLTELIIENE